MCLSRTRRRAGPGQGVWAPLPGGSAQGTADLGEVGVPDLPRRRREHVIPDRRKAPHQLGQSAGTGHEPPVQMLGPVSPPAHVDPFDVVDAANRPLDPAQHRSEIACDLIREVTGLGVVDPGFQEDHDRQTVRFRGVEPPGVIDPEIVIVRRGARPTSHATGTCARGFGHRRVKRSAPHRALKREGLPLLDRGWTQCLRAAAVDLVGVFGHGR